jgi:hypothetical protein
MFVMQMQKNSWRWPFLPFHLRLQLKTNRKQGGVFWENNLPEGHSAMFILYNVQPLL